MVEETAALDTFLRNHSESPATNNAALIQVNALYLQPNRPRSAYTSLRDAKKKGGGSCHRLHPIVVPAAALVANA
jgi:hypothetical protein